MSENNHIDDLMRSILERGQEDVPARVWESVSAGLDKAARRRTVIVWFRRAGLAAAAAIAAIVMLNIGTEETFVPAASESHMIAVLEPEPVTENTVKGDSLTEVETIVRKSRSLLAYTEPVASSSPETVVTEGKKDMQTPVAGSDSRDIATAAGETQTAQPVVSQDGISSWVEDETEIRSGRIKTSIVLSGIAGTNNPQDKGGVKPMRSPVMERRYTKTTLEQIGEETTYGIPFSAGLGVKLHFTERWSLGVGVNYSILTSRFNGKYIKVNEDGVESLPVHGKTSNVQHYIGIPINAYYNIVSRDFINFYAYAGGTVEKCIANRYRMMTDPVINHTEDVKGVQLSADLGIGVEFQLGKHLGIYIDPSLRYYFRNRQPKSIRTAQPLMLGFEMGLRFNL